MSTELSAQGPTMPRLVTGLALLGILVFILPLSASAAALVNINTAGATQLATLPGIGPSKASAIIEYRTEHGPFAAIAGIQEVSGIGPSTYADIEELITVSGSNTASAPAADADSPAPAPEADASASSTGAATAGGNLSVQMSHPRAATLGTPVAFSASVSQGGHADSAAAVSWSFGDGSSASGRSVEKTYRYAGTYAIHAAAADGGAAGAADATIMVMPAMLRIAAVTGEGILLANDASTSADLSGWRLTAGMSSFYLPSGMTLLPAASILLSQAVTGLPMAYDAKLYAADGQLAAAYAPPMPAPPAPVLQPSAPAAGSYKEQNVESAQVISVSDTAHGTKAVSAPAAPTEVAAAGAALSVVPEEDAGESLPAMPLHTRITKALESPWSLGVLGLLVFSGGALIVL